MVFTSNNRLTAPLLVLVFLEFSPLALAVFESQSFVNSNPVIIKAPSETITLVKGKPSHFRFTLEIHKDFRVFMDEINLRLASKNPFKIVKYQGLPQTRDFDPISKKDKEFLQGLSEFDIEFAANAEGDAGEVPLTIQFKYEACTTKVCLSPKTVYLSTRVNVINPTQMRLPSSISTKTNLPSAIAKGSTGIHFKKYTDKLYEKSLAQKKPILIDFYASWCDSCARLKKDVFNTAEAAALTAGFVTLSVDLSDPTDENALLREKFGVRNLPNVTFINAGGQINHELTISEFEEAPHFYNRIRFFLND